jgi:predicted transposase/invertase (TIGR01784 family)
MNEISGIHDKFFRNVFSNVENAKDLLRNALPESISKEIDYDNVNVLPNSFIDKNLKDSYSDLLIETKLKGEMTYIYCLVEHKSYLDKYVFLQLLGYMVKIWQRDFDNKKEYLTPIIPMILYHGENKWTIGVDFSLYFKNKERFKDYIPNFKSVLYDLEDVDDLNIKGNVYYEIAIKVLKYVFKGLDDDMLIEILKDTHYDENDYTFKNFIIGLFFYLVNVGKLMMDRERTRSILNKIYLEKGDKLYMNWIEEVKKEGREEGKKEGREEGKKEGREEGKKEGKKEGREEGERKKALDIAKKMIKKGMDIETIEEFTGLTKKEIVELKKEIKKGK